MQCEDQYTYAFLAGFPRSRGLNKSLGVDQSQLWERLINNGRGLLKQYKADLESEHHNSPIFHLPFFVEKIDDLKTTIYAFRPWIVGLDLMGDELGYPFIPFTLPDFKKFIKEADLGVRIHGGENPQYDVEGVGLSVHMTILLLGIRDLHFNGIKLRIGHGTDLATMFERQDYQLPKYVILFTCGFVLTNNRWIYEQRSWLKTIPLEVNLTSNHYLLYSGQLSSRKDDSAMHPLPQLCSKELSVVLATDNDGIWPIDQCPFGHIGK